MLNLMKKSFSEQQPHKTKNLDDCFCVPPEIFLTNLSESQAVKWNNVCFQAFFLQDGKCRFVMEKMLKQENP